MDLGLRDRVYIVTGGSRGLGFATARQLVDDGARVVISGLDETEVSRVATKLSTSNAILTGWLDELREREIPRDEIEARLAEYLTSHQPTDSAADLEDGLGRPT